MKVASQYAGFGRQPASAEDWMAEQYLAAKRAEEEKMAEQHLAAKRAVEEKLMAEQHLAGKHAEEEEKMAEPHLAGKRAEEKSEKKTKVVRLNQGYIDVTLARMPLTPFPGIPDELLDKMEPEKRDGLRALLDSAAAIAQEHMDYCEDIRQQYLAKGYAEIIEEDDSDAEAEAYKEYLEYMAGYEARVADSKARLSV